MPDLTTAPGTIALGPHTFVVDQMTLATAGPLYQWMNKRARDLKSPFKNVLDKIDGVPEQYRALIMQEAAKLAVANEVTDSDRNDALVSPEGCAFLLWILTRKQHPTVELSAIQEQITPYNFLDIFLKVKEAGHLDEFQKMAEAKLHGANR